MPQVTIDGCLIIYSFIYATSNKRTLALNELCSGNLRNCMFFYINIDENGVSVLGLITSCID